MIDPLEFAVSNYFHYFGVRGALLMQIGRKLTEARTHVQTCHCAATLR